MFKFKRASALAVFIIAAFGLGITAAGAAPVAAQKPLILSIEAFTVTGGFVLEPLEIEVTASSTLSLSDLLNEYFGSERIGLQGQGATTALTSFRVRESHALRVHSQIATVLVENNIEFQDSVRNEGYLTGRDFVEETSGWVIILNNRASELAPDVLRPQAGDVVRVVFTVFGGGADLGLSRTNMPATSTRDPIFPEVNRDELLTEIAARDVVDFAIRATAANPSVTQGELDAAVRTLHDEYDEIDPPDNGNGNGNGGDYDEIDPPDNGNGNGSGNGDLITTPPQTPPPQTPPPQTEPNDKIPERPPAPTGVGIFGLIPLISVLIVLMVIFKRRKRT